MILTADVALQSIQRPSKEKDVYYLFLRKKADLDKFRKEFDRVKTAISEGKTPVFSEMRGAKTALIEAIPYQSLSGVFLVLSSLAIQAIQMNELVKVAIVLVLNGLCSAIANFLFTLGKHHLRLCLLKRMGLPGTEENIAALESLEYQSV